MPDTEAGKRLWNVLDKLLAVLHGIATADLPENIAAASKTTYQVKAEMEKLIDAIEAEAVAAERGRIKVAVEGRMVTRTRPAEHEWSRGFRDGWNDAIGTALRIIEGDTP